MPRTPDNKQDGGVDNRPYLCIPYWPPAPPSDPDGDTGTVRPLPASVISWLCQGIHASPYNVGRPVDIQVDVHNSGAANTTAVATVIVYWSEPVVGGLSRPAFFGAQNVPVPPRGAIGQTAVMTNTVPSSSPHICIFAVVTHALDKPGTAVDPVNDRHWAQHNLQTVAVSPKKIVHMGFTAANPLRERDTFEVEVRAMDERRMETLAELLKASARMRTQSLRVQLLDNTGKKLTEAGPVATMKLDLRPQGRRGLHLTMQLDEPLEQHEFAALEVSLSRGSGKRKELVGSLGIVMRPEVSG